MVGPTTRLRIAPYTPLVTSDLTEIRGERAVELHSYWLQKRVGARPPLWSNFEFMELYRIAPFMVVMDVPKSREPNELRYRFMGTEIVTYRSERKVPDLTGRTFGDGERVYDPQPMLDAFKSCMENAVPVVMIGEYQTENSYGAHERLVTPWVIDGQVARLITVLERMPKHKAMPTSQQ